MTDEQKAHVKGLGENMKTYGKLARDAHLAGDHEKAADYESKQPEEVEKLYRYLGIDVT